MNGRALTVLLGSSSSLLHGTYSIFYRKDYIHYIYYMSASLMRTPSKRPAFIINTIQFAWHNSNFIMQNMHLKKPNFNHVRVTIYSLNCLCLGKIQQQTRLRGLKHARETSKYTSGCLERTSLFKLRRNTQNPDIHSFSIFEIIRK